MAAKSAVKNKDHTKVAENKVSSKFDFRWIVVIVLLVLLTTIGIILNINHDTDYISLVANSIDIDNGDLKINWSRYSTYEIELDDTLEITQAGIYHLTGEMQNGYVFVNVSADDPVKLILDNVKIENSNGPAIYCAQADDLVIELVGENYLSDGAEYSADFDVNVDGVIFSKADTTLQGSGFLEINGNYQDGIVSKDDLKINGGTYNIKTIDDGMHGKDSVYVVSGEIAIYSGGDSIKSNNDTDAGKGFVKIENGDITIDSGDDGIHAYNNLIIDDGTVNIKNSYEGLEAQNIVINNGDVKILASDDGINAGGGAVMTTGGKGAMEANPNCIISINGGNIYVNSAGDGIDSNGYLYFNGGKVVVDGPTNNGNGALDAGAGIVMNSGEVVAVGASGMAESLGENSKAYNVSIYFDTMQAKETNVEIKNSTDETIISFTSAKNFSHMAVGSGKFSLGETYIIYINGEEYQKFTIENIVTTVGNSGYNMQGMPGGRGAQGAQNMNMQAKPEMNEQDKPEIMNGGPRNDANMVQTP